MKNLYNIFTFLIIALFLLFNSTKSIANTYYVDRNHSSANDINPGTINLPWLTIQHAAETIIAGDTVLIRNGTYNEQILTTQNGNASNGFIVFSAYQNEAPIIDGIGVNTGNNGIIVTHSYIKFIGLTIKNWADNGMEINNCESIEILKMNITNVTGGIHFTGTVHNFIVDSCIMYDYYGGSGGFGFDATPEGTSDSIYNGVIKNSKAYITVGAFDNCDGFALGHDGVSNIYFYNCEVYGVGDGFDISGKDVILEKCIVYNSTYGGGYKLWRDNVTLINCIGYNNITNLELDFDDIANKGVIARLINCTFWGSWLYNIHIENSLGLSKLEMFNCIVSGGSNIGLAFDENNISCYSGDFNLFHGNASDRVIATSEYDFSSDQILNGDWSTFSGQDAHSQISFNSGDLFMDTLSSNIDLHLVSNSPAIDNGTGTDAPIADFDGNPRPSGMGYDIGAYEYQFPSDIDINRINNISLGFILFQNYPNPFNPVTRIKYSIPKTNFVSIKVYDILGQEVATLVNEEKSPGNYRVNFNAGNLASGIYIYRISAGIFISSKKMLLLK